MRTQQLADARRQLRGPARDDSDWLPAWQRQTLELQRSVGNRVIARAVRAVRQLDTADEGSHEKTVQRACGVVAAEDPAKEAEADSVATRATARYAEGGSTGESGRGGPGRAAGSGAGTAGAGERGRLPAPLLQALAPELGRTGRLGQVRFDTSPGAAREARSIGAHAFSAGERVAFDDGELDLSTRSGVHLAAHEAAHASLHPVTPGAGRQLVNAKLRGTRAAAEAMGGTKSGTGIRKYLFKKSWDQVLDGLEAYEKLEDKVLAGGPPSPTVLNKARPGLLKSLLSVEQALLSWQEANQAETPEESSDSVAQERFENSQKAPHEQVEPRDQRSKTARRQTVAMLLPRVRTEAADLAAGRWDQTLGISDEQMRSQGREDQGQKNKVQELNYETESGEFSGYFKEEKGYAKDIELHELDVGIKRYDPNYGARAMAMYRLDQLLGAGVTARVEWAVHDNKLGTVMQSVKPRSRDEKVSKAPDVVYSVAPVGENAPGTVSVDDVVFQRCLNKLQILDVISGQLDRHTGNYFIHQDTKSGQVTGVTGIDLDMAFGGGMNKAKDAKTAENFKGLPPEIDEEFGTRILSIDPSQIEQALTGLLTPEEVRATMNRFQEVKDKVAEAQSQGLLRRDWDRSSSLVGQPVYNDTNFGFARKTYAVDLAKNLGVGLRPRIDKVLDEEIPLRFDVFGEHARVYKTLVNPTSRDGAMLGALSAELYNRTLDDHHLELIVEDTVRELSDERTWRDQVDLAAQEGNESTLNYQQMDAVIMRAYQRARAFVGA